MKIYGTKIEIQKSRDGQLFSNIDNPSMEKVLIDRAIQGSKKYYAIDTMLSVCRKHDDEQKLGRIAMKRLALCDISVLKSCNYGTTWNFKSVIEDAMILDAVTSTLKLRNDYNENIAPEEDKTFVHITAEKKTRKPRAPKINFGSDCTDSDAPKKEFDLEALRVTIQNTINFFSEFDFEPNFRFLNTLSRNSDNKTAAKRYIHNYFALIDSPYINDIDNKMKSPEFDAIYEGFAAQTTEKKINRRLAIYYGAQGTGKTTKACQEADNCCIVCNNSMLPADLMQDFDFDDGKATFKSSALYDAIVNGKTIVLDEINLLPFESLRFLQGIVDGKSSFIYKDREVKIADGFKIIGTMNLFVNGMAYALPSPLVDRCESIEEFKLTANDLIYSIA